MAITKLNKPIRRIVTINGEKVVICITVGYAPGCSTKKEPLMYVRRFRSRKPPAVRRLGSVIGDAFAIDVGKQLLLEAANA